MSTSLDNLPPPSAVPVSASGSGSGSNASLMDANSNYNPNIDLPPAGAGGGGGGGGESMDVNTIQELVQGLQQADASGATSLPVRDISQSTTSVVADEQAKPNYVPSNRRVRFEEEEDDDEMEYERTAKKQSAMNRRIETANSIYDELQIPILLAILYFVFQLPVIRLFLYKHLPMLFESVGAGLGSGLGEGIGLVGGGGCSSAVGFGGMQMNLIGLCLTSAVFGFGYLFLSKIMAYLSSF